jgi:hypothetical protein
LSVEQKPPSVQTPFAQKQPAAHWLFMLHWKPGGLPDPVLPPPALPPAGPFGPPLPSSPDPLLFEPK